MPWPFLVPTSTCFVSQDLYLPIPHTTPGYTRMSKTDKRGKKEKEQCAEKIIHTLTDRKLSAIKAMLEKDHAIDCIFLLMIDKGQWKLAREFMKKSGLTLPDGTFRARMIEIEENGLAEHEKIDVKKKRWTLTQFGKQVGQILLDLFGSMPAWEAHWGEPLTC
jgi:hypothetical protein